ncbi:MAG: class I SAM-dependent methyltransferase [Nanoarchaeota archaeon]|nr:class I SAM-dependent methyltransferase [Nanoarchaeota archaeon]
MQINWHTYAKEYDILCHNNPEYLNLISVIKNQLKKIINGTNQTIVELGSGTGNFSIEIAKQTPHNNKIISLEYTKEFLQLQKEKIKKSKLKTKINLIQSDIRNMPFSNNSLDVVLMVHVLNFFKKDERDKILADIYSKIKPNKYFIIADIGREINVGKWALKLYGNILKNKGLKALIDFHKNTAEVRKQNSNANKRQKNGTSYLHNLNEFEEYISSFGFKIIHSQDNLYGGIDDLIIAQKPQI